MKREPIPAYLRLKVLERDKFTCQYCGKHAHEGPLEIDHIIPVAKGGTNHIDNLITSCKECNRGKRDRILAALPYEVRIKKLEEKVQALNTTVAYLSGETKYSERYVDVFAGNNIVSKAKDINERLQEGEAPSSLSPGIGNGRLVFVYDDTKVDLPDNEKNRKTFFNLVANAISGALQTDTPKVANTILA